MSGVHNSVPRADQMVSDRSAKGETRPFSSYSKFLDFFSLITQISG